MEIKMPIKFHATYAVTVRCDGKEKRERCQKLTVSELPPQDPESAPGREADSERPTHQITFYDFGCKRILEGSIRENDSERLVLRVQDKEYEFSLYKPSR